MRRASPYLAGFIVLVPAILLPKWLGWEFPAWAWWIGPAVPFVIGCVILAYPRTLSSRRPILARAFGTLLVGLAAYGAYSHLAGVRD